MKTKGKKHKIVNEEGKTLWIFRYKLSANEMLRELHNRFPARKFSIVTVNE